MLKTIVLFILALVLITLLACQQKSAPTEPEAKKALQTSPTPVVREGWEAEWERVKKEARKEGKLVLFTTHGAEVRLFLGEALREYEIALDFVGGRDSELAEKILRERKAGIYNTDLFISGFTTIFNVMIPAGLLQPLEPLLILPEVKDPKLWYKGKLNFADKDRLAMAFLAYIDPGIHINTDIVKPGDIKSMQDLLSPKWKGKIIIDDPTTSGRGQQWLAITTRLLGEEYTRQLARQEPLLTRDRRQLADWVSRGRYPIGLGIRPGEYQEFKRAGAPISNLVMEEVSYLLGGAGYVGYLNKAPNPNASRVFLNWLLSKKGQTMWQEIRLDQSARIDTPLEHLEKASLPLRKEGVDYFDNRTETWEMESSKYRAFVVNTFTTLAR